MAAIGSVIEKTRGLDYEIIVVDNDSNDGVEESISREFPQVRTIVLPENIGFGRANNEGIRVAKGRNVLLLNTDTLLVNGAIKILSDYLDTHPKVGICGGNLYDLNMVPMHSFGRMPSIWDELCELSMGVLPRIVEGRNRGFNYSEKPLRVGYITGADMMIRGSLLKKTGGFDPDFFMYYEEVELTWRIKRMGCRVVSVPGAKIIHYESQSVGSQERKDAMRKNSRNIYFRKTHGRIYTFTADLLHNLAVRLRRALGR